MKKRCIYSYEFEDNSVYVGLTWNLNNRKYKHTKDNSSSVHEKLTFCKNFKFNQLTDFIDPSIAKKQEDFFIKKYKNEGWTILNKTGAGSLGGNILKWEYEKCKEESSKYKTIKELKSNSLGCYLRIVREKWNDLFDHMINARIKWTKEKCLEEIKNYKSYSDYRIRSKSYDSARNNKWLEEICELFDVKKQKHKNYWTKEKCMEESKRFSNRKDFYLKSKSAYCIAHKNKWLDDICSHMKQKHKFTWTDENIEFILKNYHKGTKYCSEILNISVGAVYNKLYRMGIKINN